ncbi:MAG: hypothetical protein JNK04_24060 [Myxococcales bacterium]|nr:hypothetical protein [Myxococcales bacterium]
MFHELSRFPRAPLFVIASVAACTEVRVERDDGGGGGSDPGCPKIACDLACDDFLTGPDGCVICECAPPGGCEPVPCNLACPETGFVIGPDGCALCQCNPTNCPLPSPAGCVANGCPDGEVCDTSLGCLSSGCSCDETSGTWACDPDCGGGICVPDPTGCDEPNPAGCINTGCPPSLVCMPTSGVCIPSDCYCDAGSWACTNDCAGGLCSPP